MKFNNALLLLIIVICSASINSCLKTIDCKVNVFEDEGLYMSVYVDDQLRQVSDTAENQIFGTLRYQIDTTRQDTVIFYYDCNYFFNDGEEAISLTIMKYADFSEVYNYGYGILNYARFDDLSFAGNYDFARRTSALPDHGVDIRYFRIDNDTLVYWVDESPDNPEDFYFSADNFVRKDDQDCYGRNFSWYSYDGTFGCRLVEPETGDTVIIRDAEYRAIMMQLRYTSYY
ncbi:MAG TPA: hypothetical protein ENN61_04420 [Bacteroidaceae bacterium]|nr:hypothetical protein [Bacteroidaceae bacterium]